MAVKLNSDLMLLAPWINGIASEGEHVFSVHNPASGALIADVIDANKALALQAIDAADKVQSAWRFTAPRQRALLLEAWAKEIEQNLDDLAFILTAENGKRLCEAKNELAHGASALKWSAQSLLRTHGDTLPIHSSSQRNYTVKQPIGVVACITPWNFPAAAVLVKLGAALAAGCTVVLKPSEETPLIALALVKLSKAAKFPDGVINALPCGSPEEVGLTLCEDKRIKMVSFTGSTAVGKRLYTHCAKTVKRVALELGGNAPYIVFPDADLDKAIDDVMNACFYNSGQICVGANRIFVHTSLYSAFSEKLASRISSLKVGNGLDVNTEIGPLINLSAKQRLNELLSDALAKGAKQLTPIENPNDEDLFFSPVLLLNTSKEMRVYSEEIFGPIACLYAFDTDDEVIKLANDTEAGLVAYIYSQNIAKLIYVSERLDAGVIGANSTQVFSDDLPFGGFKESGLGTEHGFSCLEAFTQSKSVCLDLNYSKVDTE